MPNPSTRTYVDRCPVIYAGGFIDHGQVVDDELPNDCIVLSRQDTLSYKLTEALNRAHTLVFLDLLSFPFEVIADDHWNVPIVVVLPSDFDVESLITTFGSVLLEHLGIFDRIVTSNSILWEELRRKYCWAEGQHIPVTSNRPREIAAIIRTLLDGEPTSPTTPNHDRYGPARYWHDQNRRLATSVSHRAVGTTDYNPCFSKALHRVQAAALGPRFTAAREKRGRKVPLDVLEVGTGVGRWATSFDLTETRFFGLESRKDLLKDARANFPEQRFDRLSSDLLFPYEDESFDLVFSVAYMHHNSTPAKRTLLSEMWRVTRPGGQLLFLENFVFMKQSEKPDIHPTSVTEFVDLILDQTNGQVVLEHVESLQYPDEDLRRSGLISFIRLGVPRL